MLESRLRYGATRKHRIRNSQVLALGAYRPGDSSIPLLAGRPPVAGRATAYVCIGFACTSPVTEPEALAELLDEEE
jgi:uncharacterized protein YyaL (SSP411 family)